MVTKIYPVEFLPCERFPHLSTNHHVIQFLLHISLFGDLLVPPRITYNLA